MGKEMEMEMEGRGIPEDVMVEILKRLPVKSLLRSKSTSKGWCALINSPNFIKSHLRFSSRFNNSDGFLLVNREPGAEIIPDDDDDEAADSQFSPMREVHTHLLIFPDDDESLNGLPIKLNTDYLDSVVDLNRDMSIMGCCDGILCLCSSWSDQIPPVPFSLWNPATREYKSLPNSTHYTPSASDYKNADNIRTDLDVAFGFDAKNDDHKVVAFISIWEGLFEYVTGYTELYSLKSNSWRLIDPVIPLTSPNSTYVSTLNARGFFHRVVSLDNHESNALLSLDMEEEVYRATPGPPSRCINPWHPYGVTLATTSDPGSIVAMYYENFGGAIEVWHSNQLFKSDCNWTLQYTLELPPPRMFLEPLRLWKNYLLFRQSGMDFSYYIPEDNVLELYLHDPCTEITRKIQFPGLISSLLTYDYKETLVSLS